MPPESDQAAAPSVPLLTVRDLAVTFPGDDGETVRAVDGVNFTIYPGQTVALVGESGCGKSVTAMSILRLIPSPPGETERGSIELAGRELITGRESDVLDVRGAAISMIFQEPTASLNPVLTVGDQIMEVIRRHQKVDRRTARHRAIRAMRSVGIREAEQRLNAYPHQFSGGMCQRVAIAMALACRPRLLIADEPTTALDVTIQAQILGRLRALQAETGMSILLITHDLGVVAEFADVVCVMYAGRVVEYASVHDLFEHAYHPYTKGLLASIPRIGRRRRRLTTVAEVVADEAVFREVPRHAFGVVPWWPAHDPPADLVPAPNVPPPDYRLIEVSEGHWVGVWRTRYVADHPKRTPDLPYKRPRSAPASA